MCAWLLSKYVSTQRRGKVSCEERYFKLGVADRSDSAVAYLFALLLHVVIGLFLFVEAPETF